MTRERGGGPKSRRGKEIASRNSLRHGVLSARQVIPTLEDHGEWVAMVEGLHEEWQPQGTMERELVEHIGAKLWNLRRIRRATDAEVLHSIYELPSGYEPTARLGGGAVEDTTEKKAREFERAAERRLVPSEHVVEKLARYEAHEVRTLQKLTAELRALQEARRDEEPGKTWIEVRKAE